MPTSITPPPADPGIAAILAELREVKLELFELKVAVRTKVATPIESLTVREAIERLRCGDRTFRRLLARRLFTDARPEKVAGAPWKILADEIEEYRLRGEDGLALFRERMGR